MFAVVLIVIVHLNVRRSRVDHIELSAYIYDSIYHSVILINRGILIILKLICREVLCIDIECNVSVCALHIIGNHFFCLLENNKIIAVIVELVVQIYGLCVTCHIFVSHLTIVFVIILIPGPLAVDKFTLGKFRNVVILKDHFEQFIFFSPVCGGIPCAFFFQSDDLKCCFLCIGKLWNCCFGFLCCLLKILCFLLDFCKICCGSCCLGTCFGNCCIISCLCCLKLI